MFPFFARFSLSSFFWAWSFTLGVGSQFSQIGLGQFEFSGSFGIFQLRHRRSRRMDRWPLFPKPCKKGCSDSSGRLWSVFGSLPKNLWTTCMLISGLPFKIAFEPGIFSSFRTSPKIQDSDYVHRTLLGLSLGVFSPDPLSPGSREF